MKSQTTSAADDQVSEHAKVVKCKQTRARIYWCSGLLPEATDFKVYHMPKPEVEPEVLNILIVSGNLSKFGNDILQTLLTHWLSNKGEWHHVVFAPGPHDYAAWTVELGDSHCSAIEDEFKGRVSVMIPNAVTSVFFTGIGLRIVGAPCWPVDRILLEDARVYENLSDKPGDPISAVAAKNFVKARTLKKRLEQDVAVMLGALLPFDGARQLETRIAVTYGCPDEQLAVGVPGNHHFRGSVTLGNAKRYEYFSKQVDYWIYGAVGDKPRDKLGNMVVASNVYDEIQHTFPEKGMCLEVRRKEWQ